MTAEAISGVSICILFIISGKKITDLQDTTVRDKAAASYDLCLYDNTLIVPRANGKCVLQYELFTE